MMTLTDDTLSGRPVTTIENPIPSKAVEDTETDCGNNEPLIKSIVENNLKSLLNFYSGIINDKILLKYSNFQKPNYILEIILN